jgi:hypothetical protein
VKKILITATVALLVIAVVYFLPRIGFAISLSRSMQHQQAEIERMRPGFNAAILQRLSVGQSVEDAEKVLNDAGLNFQINREVSPPKLTSMYPPGHSEVGPGFLIELELGSGNRISKIDMKEIIDAP